MKDKKLIDCTANEVLFELRNYLQYSWTDDCVIVHFYAKHKIPSHKIGTYYTLEAMGEWILENKVKAFEYSVKSMKLGEGFMYEISLVIDF